MDGIGPSLSPRSLSPLLSSLVFLLLPLHSLACLSGLSVIESTDPRSLLGGDVSVEWTSPVFRLSSLFGQFKIWSPSDLNCASFDVWSLTSCRWRNEWSLLTPSSVLPWIHMKGHWDLSNGSIIFGTRDVPDGSFLLVGSSRRLRQDTSSLLVSDPIQCQQGDGLVSFRYWTSPMTRLRVCTRRPSMRKSYDWCSDDITVGDPGPAKVVIPGSLQYTFEIVIEAYSFVLEAFGKQGGAVAIDDIFYDAAAVYNCRTIAHRPPVVPYNSSTCSSFTCGSFSNSTACKSKWGDFSTSSSPIGSHHMGIRKALHGPFGFVRGPSVSSLVLPRFYLPRQSLVQFCFYSSTRGAKFMVSYTSEGSEKPWELFHSSQVGFTPHTWVCETVGLTDGRYSSLELRVEGLSDYSFFGLDEVALIDPSTLSSPCPL